MEKEGKKDTEAFLSRAGNRTLCSLFSLCFVMFLFLVRAVVTNQELCMFFIPPV